MKLKLCDIHPNPMKLKINGGKLNREQIDRIKGNMKELGLMGSIPIFKLKDKYHCVSHHHRIQALKETFGINFEVDVDLKDYNKDKFFKGLVVENLSQRGQSFMEIKEHIAAILEYLEDEKEILTSLRAARKDGGKLHINDEFKDKPVARDICEWVGGEKVIKHDEVTNYKESVS
jgi:hypothetical protein